MVLTNYENAQEMPYELDLKTCKKISKYDRRGSTFRKDNLLPRSQHHAYVISSGSSLEDLLKNLEKKANLPEKDLYITNLENPLKSSDSVYHEIDEYNVASRKAEKDWTDSIDKYLESKGKITLGYIFGTMHKYSSENSPELKSDKPVKFIGSLSISENCPGVFEYNEREDKNICSYCGENERGLRV